MSAPNHYPNLIFSTGISVTALFAHLGKHMLPVLTSMKRLSLVQALTGVLSFATTSAAESLRAFEPPSVNSTSGLLIGHKAEHRPNSYEFLGVKYGQAPTGELRFASPKRYVAPEGTVFEASKWVSLRSLNESDTV